MTQLLQSTIIFKHLDKYFSKSKQILITGGWQGSIDSLIMSRYSNDSPQIPSPRPHWPQNSSDHCTLHLKIPFGHISVTFHTFGHFLVVYFIDLDIIWVRLFVDYRKKKSVGSAFRFRFGFGLRFGFDQSHTTARVFYHCIGSVDVLENWPLGLFMFHSYNHQP